MAVNPIPEGYRTVTPYLVVEGAANVLEFVKQAFGAEEKVPHGRRRTERSAMRRRRSATRS